MRAGAGAALAVGVGLALRVGARAQDGPVGGKPQLVLSVDTLKTTIPGLEGLQLAPQAEALLGPGGGQRLFRAQLWTPGQAPASASSLLELPAGLKLGDSLQLTAPRPGSGGRVERGEGFEVDRFWGSGDAIRAGQPHVYKGKELTTEMLARWYNLRRRDAVSVPEWTEASWPAATQRVTPLLPADASPVGKYSLKSSYVKPLSFDVPATVTFLPPLGLSAPAARQPDLTRDLPVSWKPLAGALGYMAVATGMRGKDALVVWTSTEKEEDALQAALATPEGLQDAATRGLLRSPDKTQVTVPARVFAGCEGVVLQVVAYGSAYSRTEGNLTVRVQTRSIGMLSLGHGGFGGK